MYRHDDTKIACMGIREGFGIELTWTEKLALSHYLDSFIDKFQREKVDTDIPLDPLDVAVEIFIRDYFGLDTRSLEIKPVYSKVNGRTKWRLYGSDFIGTPEFKNYCRTYVNLWREERTYP